MNLLLYKEYNGAICAGFKLDDNAPIELGFEYKDKTYLGWNNMPGWRGSNGIVYPGHINNKLELNPGEAVFLLCRNNIITTSESINTIYERYKEDDGFLYFIVTKENAFGNYIK